MNKKQDIIIYKSKSGALELKGELKRETLWATQKQIATIFNIDRSVVTKHINNIFKNSEINSKSNVQKMHIASSDKPIAFYSLDVILAVGYRANSVRAIKFRKWATKIIRSHILNGYTVDRARIKKNYIKFLNAVDTIKKFLPVNSQIKTEEVIELIKTFTVTWLSLDAYDKQLLPISGVNRKNVKITCNELINDIAKLKSDLFSKKLVSDLFAKEREIGNIKSIVNNLFQSVFNKDAYPTIEEKAANLLYFIVKNHPFVDGNKRCGAFAFIWFLQKAKILDIKKLSPETLTALTLLIAESKSSDKDKMIGLILLLLKKDL